MLIGKANNLNIKPSWMLMFSEQANGLSHVKGRYDLSDLLADIQHNLSQILNYKRYSPSSENEQADASLNNTIVSYGMPDLSLFNPQSESDRQAVHVLLKRAIERFEPRLINVYISDDMQANQANSTVMHFEIHAEVNYERSLVPVNFYSQVCTPADDITVGLS